MELLPTEKSTVSDWTDWHASDVSAAAALQSDSFETHMWPPADDVDPEGRVLENAKSLPTETPVDSEDISSTHGTQLPAENAESETLEAVKNCGTVAYCSANHIVDEADVPLHDAQPQAAIASTDNESNELNDLHQDEVDPTTADGDPLADAVRSVATPINDVEPVSSESPVGCPTIPELPPATQDHETSRDQDDPSPIDTSTMDTTIAELTVTGQAAATQQPVEPNPVEAEPAINPPVDDSVDRHATHSAEPPLESDVEVEPLPKETQPTDTPDAQEKSQLQLTATENEPPTSDLTSGAQTAQVMAPSIDSGAPAPEIPTVTEKPSESEPSRDAGQPQQPKTNGPTKPDADNRPPVNTNPIDSPAARPALAPVSALPDSANGNSPPVNSEETPDSTPSSNALNPTTDSPVTAAERLSHQLFPRSAAASEGGVELSPSDQVRFIKRVAQAIQAAPQRGGSLRLRLHPPELGSMSLEVVTQRGSVTARIETESHAARSLLLEHLPELRERLDQQGVRIERFDVDVTRHDSSNEHRQPHDPQQQTGSTRIGRADRNASGEDSQDQESARISQSIDVSAGNINIVI